MVDTPWASTVVTCSHPSVVPVGAIRLEDDVGMLDDHGDRLEAQREISHPAGHLAATPWDQVRDAKATCCVSLREIDLRRLS